MTGATLDVIILGGGPAGLAAGVYLGRYCRPTLILDRQEPQTRWHRPTAHNVLGFPAGITRNQLLEWGRAHVEKYNSVAFVSSAAKWVRQIPDPSHKDNFLFEVVDADTRIHHSRGLLVATGIEYLLPDIPDIFAYAGRTIWHCPECDGFKCLGKDVAVLGHGNGSADMALSLKTWCNTVALLTLGQPPNIDDAAVEKLNRAGINIIVDPVVRIRGDIQTGTLEGLEFENGKIVAVSGAFANIGCTGHEGLLSQLPIHFHKKHWIMVDHRMRTAVPRCYAAGDVVAHAQTQLTVAIGTGATAAIWLHKELLSEHFMVTPFEPPAAQAKPRPLIPGRQTGRPADQWPARSDSSAAPPKLPRKSP